MSDREPCRKFHDDKQAAQDAVKEREEAIVMRKQADERLAAFTVSQESQRCATANRSWSPHTHESKHVQMLTMTA